jgi:hypothetical protein
MLFAAENSNKFQKIRFWKEKSVEDMVTLVPMAQTTVVFYEMITQYFVPPLETNSRLHGTMNMDFLLLAI